MVILKGEVDKMEGNKLNLFTGFFILAVGIAGLTEAVRIGDSFGVLGAMVVILLGALNLAVA